MNAKYFFTIFIPTYNRGYCLKDVVLSCENSTFKDFEVVLVDDGSSDNTAQVVKELLESISFPLRYIYQKNQGKHVAFNLAVEQAQSTLFVTLDSDDSLMPLGLEKIHSLWCSMSEDEQQAFVSIEFRCLENGIASSAYPEPYLDSTYVGRRRVCSSKGEKRSAYRVDVLKEYPYPVVSSERYCRPGLIDIRMSNHYKTRFSNIIAIDAGHFPDGIGANRRKVIVSAPHAYRQYFLEEITEHEAFSSKKDLRSFYLRYCRSSLNAGVGLKQLFSEVPKKLLLLLVLPEAFVTSIADRRLKRKLIRARS